MGVAGNEARHAGGDGNGHRGPAPDDETVARMDAAGLFRLLNHTCDDFEALKPRHHFFLFQIFIFHVFFCFESTRTSVIALPASDDSRLVNGL